MEKPINPNSRDAQAMSSDQADDQPDGRDSELLAQLAALPKSMAPTNDAWQRIASRIYAEKAGFDPYSRTVIGSQTASIGRGWLALAASLLLVVTSVVVLQSGTGVQTPADQPLAINAQDGLLLNEQGARVPAASIEREYQAAFKEFQTVELSNAPSELAVSPRIQQDWELMQQLERELLAALELQPENPWLLQKLTHLRSRQLQLLHVIADSGQPPGGNLI